MAGIGYRDKSILPEHPFFYDEYNSVRSVRFGSILKYVAVFVLGLLTLYFIKRTKTTDYSNQFTYIHVPYGARTQVSLCDGTNVWLNSGTTLTYPVVFSGNTREVSVEGEAYFNVVKDSKRPFVVNSGSLKVEVYGTHFNVSAYPDDDEYAATLEEGAIYGSNITTGERVMLKPGEQLILNRKTNILKHISIDSEPFTSWKEKLLKFEDTPFNQVIKKMERWYDVKINIDQSINSDERYTMTIESENLKEMLQLVSKTTPVNYELKGRNVYLTKRIEYKTR